MDIEERAKELAEQEKAKIENKELININDPNHLTNIDDVPNEDTINLENLQNRFLKKQVDEGKTLNEITTDYAHASITNELFNSDDESVRKFKGKLKKQKQDALTETFKKEKIKSQAETISEKHKKAEALYNSFRPILEFDFSNLIHKKTNDVEGEDSQHQITYNDRSYGITMMGIMLAFLTVPYVLITILLALFNGVNAIFEMINSFGKFARGIGLTIFFIILGVIIIYLILLGIQLIFGVDVIGIIQSWF